LIILFDLGLPREMTLCSWHCSTTGRC